MDKLLIRADDLGYSRAVNYGIYESVHNGLVNNVGVMINMPTTNQGINLLKTENIAWGLHTVICAGQPLTDPSKIPSLVDETGFFKTSSVYRSSSTDFVKLSEVLIEIEAQYKKFVKIFGKKPDYFEGHAICSDTFNEGLEIAAKKFGLKLLPVPPDQSTKQDVYFNGVRLKPIIECGNKDYDPLKTLQKAIKLSKNGEIPMMVFHPGFLDNYLLTHSSLTYPRVKEESMLTSKDARDLINDNNVSLIRYDEIK